MIVGRGAPSSCANTPMHFMCSCMRRGRRRFDARWLTDTREKEAEEMVDTVDRERIAYVKHYFNADWPTRSLYHMMMNTAVGNEPVISTILDTMQQVAGSPKATDYERPQPQPTTHSSN